MSESTRSGSYVQYWNMARDGLDATLLRALDNVANEWRDPGRMTRDSMGEQVWHLRRLESLSALRDVLNAAVVQAAVEAKNEGGVSLRAIADALDTKHPTIVRWMAELKDRGFVVPPTMTPAQDDHSYRMALGSVAFAAGTGAAHDEVIDKHIRRKRQEPWLLGDPFGQIVWWFWLNAPQHVANVVGQFVSTVLADLPDPEIVATLGFDYEFVLRQSDEELFAALLEKILTALRFALPGQVTTPERDELITLLREEVPQKWFGREGADLDSTMD